MPIPPACATVDFGTLRVTLRQIKRLKKLITEVSNSVANEQNRDALIKNKLIAWPKIVKIRLKKKF